MNLHDIDVIRERTRKFIDENCIVRNTKMPGKAPGTTYTWIFYLRRGLFNRQFMSDIGYLFARKVYDEIGHYDFQLAGLETGATPLVSALPHVFHSMSIDMHSFSIRKERKAYGLMNWIEGIPNDKPVLLVDDLCNSSNSMRRAYDILTKNVSLETPPLTILPFAFSVVNKVNKGIHPEQRQNTDMYLPNNMKVIYLFDMDDFDLYNPSH